MITSATDPRDDRFRAFLVQAQGVVHDEMPIPARIEGLERSSRALAEAVEVKSRPEMVAPWAVDLAGWALSPAPVDLEPWALAALRALRRDPVRARNVARGVVDWVLGELRSRVADLRESWQAVHDAGLGYPVDPRRPLLHPARASAEVAVWSYALLRARVAQRPRRVGGG
jgi:hypothetical protein